MPSPTAPASCTPETLNFEAYTNRAMVANSVAIAQLVSLSSWLHYTRQPRRATASPSNQPKFSPFYASYYAATTLGVQLSIGTSMAPGWNDRGTRHGFRPRGSRCPDVGTAGRLRGPRSRQTASHVRGGRRQLSQRRVGLRRSVSPHDVTSSTSFVDRYSDDDRTPSCRGRQEISRSRQIRHPYEAGSLPGLCADCDCR